MVGIERDARTFARVRELIEKGGIEAGHLRNQPPDGNLTIRSLDKDAMNNEIGDILRGGKNARFSPDSNNKEIGENGLTNSEWAREKDADSVRFFDTLVDVNKSRGEIADGAKKEIRDQKYLAERMRNKESSKKLPLQLVEARERWINDTVSLFLPYKTREKIVKAVENIPLRAYKEKNDEKTMVVEFELAGKYYKFLDLDVKAHSDPEYLVDQEKRGGERGVGVSYKGVEGDVKDWKNKKLKNYVMKKKKNKLIIPDYYDNLKPLLEELGKMADLENDGEKLAMLMYMIGMEGWYWLAMADNSSRSQLRCSVSNSPVFFDHPVNAVGKMCLFSCS